MQVCPELPGEAMELQVPEVILQKRIQQKEVKAVPQVLVQWSNMPSELATWEDEEALKQ